MQPRVEDFARRVDELLATAAVVIQTQFSHRYVTGSRQYVDAGALAGLRAPGHVEHRFRGKPNTHSDGSRTPIPGRSNSLMG
jgi:hypothetical protein